MTIEFEAEAARRNASNLALISIMDAGDRSAPRSDWNLEILNDPEHGRWETILNGDAIGELTYRFVGGRVVLLSTWVAESYRRQGVANELITDALEEIRASNLKITIICPVIGEYIARNRRYAPLIDAVHPGEGASAASVPQSGDWDEQLTSFERDLG